MEGESKSSEEKNDQEVADVSIDKNKLLFPIEISTLSLGFKQNVEFENIISFFFFFIKQHGVLEFQKMFLDPSLFPFHNIDVSM